MKCFPPVFWCHFEYKVVLYYLKRERVKKHVKPLEGRQIELAMILPDSDALLFVWTVCLPQWTVAAHLTDVNVALLSKVPRHLLELSHKSSEKVVVDHCTVTVTSLLTEELQYMPFI